MKPRCIGSHQTGLRRRRLEQRSAESLKSGRRQRLIAGRAGKNNTISPPASARAESLRQEGDAQRARSSHPEPLAQNLRVRGATEAMLRSLTWPKPRIFSGSLASAMASPSAVRSRRFRQARKQIRFIVCEQEPAQALRSSLSPE
jgi:hypothetical protein